MNIRFHLNRKAFAVAARLLLAALALPAVTACVDTDDIWDNIHDLDSRVDALEKKVADTNGDIQALQTIVSAMEKNVTVTAVDETANGYVIKFSDGKIATISNGRDGQNGADGKDGKDGLNAPEISVTLGSDGRYYWTLGGELIIVDGHPLCATGNDGKDGADGTPGQDGRPGQDAIAPQVRINPETKIWEISTDGGLTWESTGVIAQGQNGSTGATGDSLFSLVNTDDPAYVTFVLSDGTSFKVARYDETNPLFAIADAEGTQQFARGESRTYTVQAENISQFSIAKPDGWKAVYDAAAGTVTITAPALGNTYAETAGTVAFNLVSTASKSLIVKIDVEAGDYELRVLTFEDADVKFPPYNLVYGSSFTKRITKWSDLIDSEQYGGDLLYYGLSSGDYMGEEDYVWYDKNNTELRHEFRGHFWAGGHPISNYIEMNMRNGDYLHQLSVYSATGGHNGSANFAVHFGYRDDTSYTQGRSLPGITFGDNKARVIDHMYIMWSTYLANCIFNGNSLTDPLTPSGYVKLVAYGYNGTRQTGHVEFFIAGNGGTIQDWTKWDLSPLGEVTQVNFNVMGDSDNGYGFSQPAYFCYDDVAVRFTE